MRALPDCVVHHFSRPLGRSPATTHMGRRFLRSTAPSEHPKTPENSPKTKFSTVWTNSFHCVEKRRKVFPLCGKIGLIFPQCGNIFSIVWKNRENIFHCVENSACFLQRGNYYDPTPFCDRKQTSSRIFQAQLVESFRHFGLPPYLYNPPNSLFGKYGVGLSFLK